MKHRPTPPDAARATMMAGFIYAFFAYLLWGFLPLYMKALDGITPLEVVAHRVVWSLPVGLFVVWVTGQIDEVTRAFRQPKVLFMASVCALLISGNWGTYIWAIANGRALDAALGYYVNPLLSVLLGALFLGERPQGLQWAAIFSAFLGGAILTYEAGSLPIAALLMMSTWAFYAYFKRSLPIGANAGFAVEVILLFPFGIALMVWFAASGQLGFPEAPLWQRVMLVGLGLVTAVPLILYANGAKRLPLTTIAIMQYLSPTLIFITAVFIFGETFSQMKLIAFGCIWLAMVLYLATFFRPSPKT